MDGGDTPQSEARAGWPAPRGEPALGREALAAWRETTAALRARAEAEGLSMGEAAKRAGVPQGTLNPWYHGAYTGNYEAVTARLRRYLAAAAESAALAAALPEAPDFVETPTARELIEALVYAQSLPEIAVATLAAGCGKTGRGKGVLHPRIRVAQDQQETTRTASMTHDPLAERWPEFLALIEAEKNVGFDRFARRMRAFFDDAGWKIAFEGDFRTAYSEAALRFFKVWHSLAYAERRQQQLVDGRFRLWVYRHDGEDCRSIHERLNGLALPPDHRFWTLHYPPQRPDCACYVVGANTAASVLRLGGTVDTPLPEGWDLLDPHTGRTVWAAPPFDGTARPDTRTLFRRAFGI